MHGTLQVCRTQTSVLSNQRQNERFGHLKREPFYKRNWSCFFFIPSFFNGICYFSTTKQNYLIRDLNSSSLVNESNWVDFCR